MRNTDKLKDFVDLYDKGHILYEDGKLYRVVGSIFNYGKGGKRISGTNLKVLEEPIPMGYLSSGNERYFRVSTKSGKKSISAYEHIIIYAIFNGIECLNNDLHIDHVDGDKHNNRIENLELVSVEENNRRLIENNLLNPPRGEDNGGSILLESDVIKIRELYALKKYNQYELSNMFKVSQGNISEIVNRKSWKHILR